MNQARSPPVCSRTLRIWHTQTKWKMCHHHLVRGVRLVIDFASRERRYAAREQDCWKGPQKLPEKRIPIALTIGSLSLRQAPRTFAGSCIGSAINCPKTFVTLGSTQQPQHFFASVRYLYNHREAYQEAPLPNNFEEPSTGVV